MDSKIANERREEPAQAGSLDAVVRLSDYNVQRIKWCMQLCDRIEPGNCAHIAANIRSSLRHVLKEVEPNTELSDSRPL